MASKQKRECKICGKICGVDGFSSHLRHKHNLTAKEYYDEYIKRDNEGRCLECGKETYFRGIIIGYQQFCSVQCGAKSDLTKSKIKSTKLELYGDANYNNSVKQRETMYKLYGGYTLSSPILKAKVDATVEEKYGTSNVFSSDYGKQLIKETNLKNLGVEYPQQSERCRKKKEKTNLKIYGNKCPANFENQRKSKQTKKEKYGDENYNNRSKARNTVIQKCEEFATRNNVVLRIDIIKQFGTSWLKLDYIEPVIYNGIYFIRKEDIKKIQEYCSIDRKTSSLESNILKFIESFYFGNIIHGSFKIIKPKQLDIYLPQKQLAIEVNGNWYHSIEYGTPKDYHLNKSLLCRELDIRLIHIYEFENLEKQKQLLKDLIVDNIDNYPKNDFNKNNLIENIPEPEIINWDKNNTIYGAGRLLRNA